MRSKDLKLKFARIPHYPAPARLGIFVLILLLVWVPVALPISLLLSSDPNLVTILTMGLLFGEFLFLIQVWGKKVYQHPRLLKKYGLEWTQQNGLDLLQGLGIGLLFTLGLFAIEGVLGWLEFQTPTILLVRIILEGLVSALGIGLAEELVFRGWLLDELQRDYTLKGALWADAIIFALLHYLKPIREVLRSWPGFPGLVLLGLTLVWAKRCRRVSSEPSRPGLLGLPIGLHAGLVWGYYIINVGQMVKYTHQVPPWITGVDSNPLAGVMGLLLLSVLAFWMRKRSRVQGQVS